MSFLKEKYVRDVVPQLKEKLGLANVMSVPRLIKVVVNMGLGVVDKDILKSHVDELALITGQKPIVTKAKKSISNFKIRAGMSVGAKVTLRGVRMYEFLERLIHAALPRIRDFRGLSPKQFDGHGGYTMGLHELEVFPEIDPNNLKAPQGVDITILTSARHDQGARELLKLLGMPFAEK
jgi:large subunit ribosomal protein L5